MALQKNISGNYIIAPAYTMVVQGGTLYMQCKTSLGVVNVYLPKVANLKGCYRFNIIINDCDANASSNNITIYADLSDKINGSPSIIINANNGSKSIIVTSGTSWQAD